MLSLFGILQGEIPNILKHLEQEDPEKATAFSGYLSAIRYENSAKYQYKHTAAEIYLSRTVDSFHVYVTDMLRAYFRKNPSELPQKVKRGKPRQVAGIGQPASGNTDHLAMIQADELLSGGLTKVLQYIENGMGLQINISEAQINDIDWAIGVRNTVIHNRGRMNDRFLNRIGDETGTLDVPLIIEPNQTHSWVNDILKGTCAIDEAFTTKFDMSIFTDFMPFPTLAEGVEIGPIQALTIDITKSPTLSSGVG